MTSGTQVHLARRWGGYFGKALISTERRHWLLSKPLKRILETWSPYFEECVGGVLSAQLANRLLFF